MRINRLTVVAAATFVGVALTASSLGPLHSTYAWAHDRSQSDRPQSDPSSQPTNRGPFSLVDHRGRTVTDKDFLGKFMLVYFGYTHCPDLCPIDLQVMVEAIEILGEQGEKVQPIFITVDPTRDTVEVMARYVRRFHPRLIGLTGTREQIDAAANTYRVRRIKFFPLDLDDEDKSLSAVTRDDSRYVVDHTATFYLVGPDGSGLVRYAHGITAEEIAEDVQRFIEGQP
ncbi:MAG: SCO family protein [Alphaproteobacteria bacterium]